MSHDRFPRRQRCSIKCAGHVVFRLWVGVLEVISDALPVDLHEWPLTRPLVYDRNPTRAALAIAHMQSVRLRLIAGVLVTLTPGALDLVSEGFWCHVWRRRWILPLDSLAIARGGSRRVPGNAHVPQCGSRAFSPHEGWPYVRCRVR